jgi:hypothetical protein
MTLTMKIYNGQLDADFYIQSHGEKNAGRPLRHPKRNCFAVWTDKENAFEIVSCLFIARKFEYYIGGSVIPFIKLSEIRKFLDIQFSKSYHSKSLKLVEAATKYEHLLGSQHEKSKMLTIAYARNAIRDIK